MALLFTSLASVITVVGRIRIAWWQVWRVLFLVHPTLFILISFLFNLFTVIAIIRLIIFIQWWAWRWWVWIRVLWYVWFPFCSGNYVDSVSDVGSGVFVLTGIESIGDVVTLVVFVPRGVKSKCGRFIEIFWLPESWFSLLVSKSVFALYFSLTLFYLLYLLQLHQYDVQAGSSLRHPLDFQLW